MNQSGGAQGGASAFSGLSDVAISSPSTGQVPVYNSVSGKWENNAVSATDSTKIPLSTIDAKGDLLLGTANDTVGRQAVGANDTLLVAASGQTNGVQWRVLAPSDMPTGATKSGVALTSTGTWYDLYDISSGSHYGPIEAIDNEGNVGLYYIYGSTLVFYANTNTVTHGWGSTDASHKNLRINGTQIQAIRGISTNLVSAQIFLRAVV